jgi:transcriptional regulator with XRE-family HTH domain
MKARMGPRIAERREKLGLSRAELARSLGVSGASVRNWELGLCRPRSNLLPAIARKLDIDEQYLRSGEAPPTPIEEDLGIAPLMEALTNRFSTMTGVPADHIVITLQFTPQS